MEILFLNNPNYYWKEKIDSLQKEFPDVKFTICSESNDRIRMLSTTDAVISWKLTPEDIENAPNLKVAFVPFTGVNNFPLDILKEKNIQITNTHANARIVAEKAVSLSLALLGRIVEFHNNLTKGKWNLSLEPPNFWTSIQGRTCGILGLGSIGRNIAKFLKAYDCRIIGFKKHKADTLPENVDEVSTSLEKVIAEAEIIYVCLPLNKDTQEIINSDVLQKMNGKYLINVGRGALINEEALYNSLKKKILAGAGIDVWYNYPGKKPKPVFPSQFPIHELPNVVLSPHIAGYTKESIEGMIDDTVDNIRSYILTGNLRNVVDKDLMY